MKLPNVQDGVISPEKIENYLLSDSHPIGRFKAFFLKNLGYDDSDTSTLVRDLLAVAQENDISETQSSDFGTKYVI